MSEFAFFRFKSNSMLATEEQQHKDEVIASTKDILRAKGIECDSRRRMQMIKTDNNSR